MTLAMDQLISRIKETAILTGEFTLRSGRTSSWYIDKYLFSTCPDILEALGPLFANRIPAGTTRLAGAELGGIPLVTVASIAADLPCIFIRNQKKGYGTAKQLEGRIEEGDRVVIIEDIATTGGQVLEAAALLESLGATVVLILATIDRQEGARENIEAAGYRFESLLCSDDLGMSS